MEVCAPCLVLKGQQYQAQTVIREQNRSIFLEM